MTDDVERVIEKPLLDNRSYRLIRLRNKLEALLVHDPEADKASAALDVNVGSFSDDEDMPGMAHAVEHLLFMGTKKFPVENEYIQYLSDNAGSYNACTRPTSTNFFFNVSAKPANYQEPSASNPSPLKGALDRFAQFFIQPLFLESTLDRELRAVDSENKKNLQADQWRLKQLEKSLSNPKHPFCHFNTGNLEVLKTQPEAKGINVRNKLMEFHETHYSANRMKLVVLGREPLDTLEDWVAELFAGVPIKNLVPNRWKDEVPFRESELGMQVFAKPVMKARFIKLCFPFLDEEEMVEYQQPSRYVSHLIGHKGPGSIFAYLKKKAWAHSTHTVTEPVAPGSPSNFYCFFSLTEEGLKNYKEVIKVAFQYISLLQETPPKPWIFDELKSMDDINFRFQQQTSAIDFTRNHSSIMQKPLPRDWLLSGYYRQRKFDSDLVEKGLARLRPDNCNITIVSQEYPGDWDKKEKWYGTKYRYEKIPDNFMAEIKKAASLSALERLAELHLPDKNTFIPTELEVERKEVKEPERSPCIIRNDIHARAWFKKDVTFRVPRANFFTSWRTEDIYASAENVLKARLFAELLQDALETRTHAAKLAGLHCNIAIQHRRLRLDLEGFSEKLVDLFKVVLDTIRDLKIEQERFNVMKDRLRQLNNNWLFHDPYAQSSVYMDYLNSDCDYTFEDYLEKLSLITADDVQDFKEGMLREMHAESYVHGNLCKKDALELTNMVETILRPRALLPAKFPVVRSLVIPPGSNYVYGKTLTNPASVNHCISVWFYVGDKSDHLLRAKTMLLEQMSHEPAFNQLRTKEQLGYVVLSGLRDCFTTCGFNFTIQSERTPEYLGFRIDAFLTMFSNELELMVDAEFERHKRSLTVKLLEKPKNLEQESKQHWVQIESGYYDFQLAQKCVQRIETLTKADMVEFFRRYIKPGSPTRAKLSVHLLAQAERTTESATRLNGIEVGNGDVGGDSKHVLIKDIQSFRAGLQATEGARSTQDLQGYEDIQPKKVELPTLDKGPLA